MVGGGREGRGGERENKHRKWVMTSVHLQSRSLQEESVRKKSAGRVWDIVLFSTNDLVGQPIYLWGKP